MKKGFSIVSIVLGVLITLCGAAVTTLGAIGLGRSR
ncbi:Uncharacterised protein [Anaerotruncus sp. 2789STDY5834896]|uniref:Uncharacterized protein n=1 Tax=uncultured Anaerotruncus sp. TaxID=905011 RepID=A0A1C6HC97_9FIRM|nr:Uncharacterised protein [uncultured Anaerotruncus sp.]